MSKLTKEEKDEFKAIIQASLGLALDELQMGYNAKSYLELLAATSNVILEVISQKKKQWREEAYEEGKEDADFNNHVERDLSLD